MADDPRFASSTSRGQERNTIEGVIGQWTSERDHYQVMHILQSHGVPAGAVLKGGEIITDPHLETRGFWDWVDHPEAGGYKQVTIPWKLSKSPRKQATPAPGLGEHNNFVLGKLLGMTGPEIEELQEQGVIGTRPIGADKTN